MLLKKDVDIKESDNKMNIMIDELIKEVNICLDNNCYMAALSLSLMLPDICGKAEFPNMKPSDRYIKWYDEYMDCFEKNPNEREYMPYLSGEVVYSLRNSILHEGNPNIDKKRTDISYFELLWREKEGSNITLHTAEAQIINQNGKEKAINKIYSINLRKICNDIVYVVNKYYKENKDKFNFFNYHIENMDYRTRELFDPEHYNRLRVVYRKYKAGDNN